MEQIVVTGSYEKVLDEIHNIIEEEGSSLAYQDPSKGILIVKRSLLSWDTIVMRIIDVTPLPGGCQVRVTSFMPPSALEFTKRMKAAELRIIEGLKRRMATSVLSSKER